MGNNVVVAVVTALSRVRAATLRFNFRGVGASEGHYDQMAGEVEDAGAAVDFLREQAGFERIALIGYSFGAAVGLQAGHDHPGVDSLVAIAPPLAMLEPGFLAGCAKPLLFITGTVDPFCPQDLVEREAGRLALEARIIRLEGADHFFFGYEERLGEHCARFLQAASASAEGGRT